MISIKTVHYSVAVKVEEVETLRIVNPTYHCLLLSSLGNIAYQFQQTSTAPGLNMTGVLPSSVTE